MKITLKHLQKIATYQTQEPLLKMLTENKLNRAQYEQCYEWWDAMKSNEYTPEQIFANELKTNLPNSDEVILI